MDNMVLKRGTKVRVRSDLISYEEYGGVFFVASMEPWLGSIITIDHICDGFYTTYICLETDTWKWTLEMFECVIAPQHRVVDKEALSSIFRSSEEFLNMLGD